MDNDYIRKLLSNGPETDCLDGIEREVAREAYALGQADTLARDLQGLRALYDAANRVVYGAPDGATRDEAMVGLVRTLNDTTDRLQEGLSIAQILERIGIEARR